MKQYFVDYEIYKNGVVVKWGNCFVKARQTNVDELADAIKSELSEDLNIEANNIRFKQFNKL